MTLGLKLLMDMSLFQPPHDLLRLSQAPKWMVPLNRITLAARGSFDLVGDKGLIGAQSCTVIRYRRKMRLHF